MKKTIFVTAIAFALMLTVGLRAHRLDEYLQAVRVSLERDRVELELDLTPGVSVAGAVIALLDRDGDGTIAPVEAEAYGQAVVADLELEFDGRRVATELSRVRTPAIDEMRDGMGTLRLQVVGRVDDVGAGRHELVFQNHHRQDGSVYLVNALVPESEEIDVVGQTRDSRQQGIRVAYSVGPRWHGRMLWLVFGVVGLSMLTVIRKASQRAGY